MPFPIITKAEPHKFKTMIVGLPGSGKSTLASKLSRPLFLDVEGGLNMMDVARTPTIKRYNQAIRVINDIHADAAKLKKDYDTIVIDSIDWLVRRAEVHASGTYTLDEKGNEIKDMKANIHTANGGYGRGMKQLYNHLDEELKTGLQVLVDDGFGICLIAHANQQELMDADGFAITKITPAIGERFMELFVQWCDNVFYLKNEDGHRKLLLDSTPTILAKNRLGRTGWVDLDHTTIQEILNLEPKDED